MAILQRSGRVFSCCVAAFCALSGNTLAQQFQYQPGLMPSATEYTEGVECADVDRDGDLDVFLADGGNFSFPGPPDQNVLLINKLIENGSLSLADESVTRLGVSLSNAKMVFTGDVDSDGWVDAMYANAFNQQRPFLHMNRGAAQPGFFDEEGTTRGFASILNSASGQFGDLDDDGDLDLILADSGASYFGGAGGKPHLYLNDGTGNFTEQVGGGWLPPTKGTQMDVRLVDIDGDLDLDFFGVCRQTNAGGNHYLMLNDGSATFTNISSTLPATSSNVYEAEVGDLDGDTDLDLFFVSQSGFNEGHMRNDSIPSGSLSFAATGLLGGSGDDNEVVLVDYDNDGDLDPLVGSLASTEALWRNNGSFSFTADFGAIQSFSDSTLDCTVADLDNDGDYDLITAQGESGNMLNRYYENTGPADTRGPVVLDHAVPANLVPSAGPWIAKARIQDAVVDDGVNYGTARADFVVLATPSLAAVSIDAVGFSPANLNVTSGTTIRWVNNSGGTRSVESGTDPYVFDSGAIGNGSTFELELVEPGVYSYSNSLGGGNGIGTITVTGSPQSTDGVYVGGGMFRFAMTGSAGAGATLVYQLSFTDWVGNERVEVFESVGGIDPLGTSLCNGDGGDQLGCTNCPCGNNAMPGTIGGCLNSAASSARINASGDLSASTPPGATNDLRFTLVGAPATVLCVMLSGGATAPTNMASPCFGLNSGVQSPDRDGIRCAVMNIKRHGGRSADAMGNVLDSAGPSRVWGGEAQPGGGLWKQGGFVAGQTRYFQVTYRENSLMVCMRGLNTSQAIGVTFTP